MVFSPWKQPTPILWVYLLVVSGNVQLQKDSHICHLKLSLQIMKDISKKLIFATSGQIFKDNQILITNFSWLRLEKKKN